MKKRSLLIAGLLFIGLLFCQNIFAQPETFTYQGSLKDGANPANGNYDFEFRLFDAPTGGVQIGGTVGAGSVLVENGVFAVQLGFPGFTGPNRFLEISVRQTGSGSAFTTLTPRQLIRSSPYSIKSLNADNSTSLGGVAANQYVLTGDARLSDARIPLPGSGDYIQNRTTLQPNSNFNISGNGTVSGNFNASNISAATLFANTITGNLPSGDSDYIQNQTTPQATSNFNISGTGTANIVNAATQYNIGGSQVLSVAGTDNLFAGVGAGNSNTTGGNNSFFGPFAGFANTTGTANSFFGTLAGRSNTSGFNNTFFGDSAGFNNTIGNSNSFFGRFAGFANTTGNANSFFGLFTGQNNTIGIDNSFFGRTAGQLNTTGSSNSFFGRRAGDSNTTGSNNTIIGDGANVGSANLTFATAIGSRAFVTQSNSLILGSINGVNSATVNTLVGIGLTAPSAKLTVAGSGAFNVNGAARFDLINTAANIGYLQHITDAGLWQLATTTGATRMVVDSSGRVGVGTSAPTELLHLATNDGQVVLGDAGCSNGFVGVGFGTSMTSCTNYSLLGNGTDTIINRPAGGVISFRSGNTSQMTIRSDGNVGMGVMPDGNRLTVDGGFRVLSGGANVAGAFAVTGDIFANSGGRVTASGQVVGDGGIVSGDMNAGSTADIVCHGADPRGRKFGHCTSSIRYKENVTNLESGMALISRLRPVTFSWKTTGKPDLGLIAEEVAEVEPLLATTNDNGEIQGVKYDRVGVVLVNAVNEQQAQIETQQKQIDEQKEVIRKQQERLDGQQSEIDALKAHICRQSPSAAFCKPGR